MIKKQKASINQNDQRENNLSLILRTLFHEKDTTRVKLAEETGLTQASITKIISGLIDKGIISEKESIGSGVGRKAILLHFNAERYYCCGVRLNRNYISCAVFNMQGEIRYSSQCSISREDGVEAAMEQMKSIISNVLKQASVSVVAIGMAVPGPFNYLTGRISLMSGFPGWNAINLRKELEEHFSLPVFIEHDANCGAMAELWYSSRPAESNMLYVCADRGIGAGIVIDSQIYHGGFGYAGEVGHSTLNIFGPKCECGNRGCLELYGSNAALENQYAQEHYDPDDDDPSSIRKSAEEILKLVRIGDPSARQAYRKTVSFLCTGIVGIINTLNPDTVVFADKIIEGGPLFLETAKDTFSRRLTPEIYSKLQITVCTLPGDPMLLGASVIVFDHMLRNPLTYFSGT